MACTVTPQQIYTALTSAGFSTVQAIGIMANGIAESGLNPETNVVDSNGYRSYGIWQFNAASYPNAAALVTGNCANDLAAQVGLLKTAASGQALAGSTPGQVAGNFAQYFERCQTCQPGGTSYNQRVADAADVAQWASSGNWPASAGSLSSGGGSSSSSGGQCGPLWTLPLVGTVITTCNARALIGGALIAGASLAGLVGLVVLAAAGFRGSGAGRVAGQVAETVPGAAVAARAVQAQGPAARRQRRAQAATAAQRQQSAAARQQAGERRRQEAAARHERGTETIVEEERTPISGEMGGTRRTVRTVRRPARQEPARGRHATA
jgi:hypothetical protein